MNTRIRNFFAQALAVGTVALLAQSAQSQVIYNNTTTLNGNFNYTVEAGNEVVAGPSTSAGITTTFSDYISSASIQFDLLQGTAPNTAPLGTEEIELNFYENNGAAVDGFASPGTRFYSSGFFTMSQLGLSTFTYGSKLTFTPNVPAPPDFTWTVAFANVASGETAGLALYTSATGGAGGNYQDAWVNTGTLASPAWNLDVAKSGSPSLQFGATLSTPEPSTIALGVMGACAFLARYRRK